MISMLSLFQCITRSSSMSSEDVKLIAIVNLIFHVSDFLRLFRMSFKYGLILSRYSFIGKVIFLFPLLSYSIIAIKVTYSYWFLIISFLLKKCLHLSNYSAIDCFIFIFFSLKRFLLFLIMLPFDSFCISSFLDSVLPLWTLCAHFGLL